MKKILYFIAALLSTASAQATAPLQHSSYGKIDRHYIYSPQLRDTVTIDIMTPDGYNASAKPVQYPVIYMHDGQNLFDANTTWNHQAWEVDSVMKLLVGQNLINPAIVVGIHSYDKTRIGDLMPQKPIERMAQNDQDELKRAFPEMKLRGDAYASFVATTLKNFVDSSYSTLPDPANTSIMGSSMGGIMSVYMICEYPDVFGNAGCVSTHWIGETEGEGAVSEAMLNYLKERVPDPKTHRIYLDHGTKDIDQFYGPANNKAIDILLEAGYSLPNNLLYITDRQAGHQERFWAKRLAIPIIFMLAFR